MQPGLHEDELAGRAAGYWTGRHPSGCHMWPMLRTTARWRAGVGRSLINVCLHSLTSFIYYIYNYKNSCCITGNIRSEAESRKIVMHNLITRYTRY